MRVRNIAAGLLVSLLLEVGLAPTGAQAPAIKPRKPVLIVSGTANGLTLPGVVLAEELVIHNDGLVTLETAAESSACRAQRTFVTPEATEKLRKDLLDAGALDQEDYDTGQTADLPYTTVTVFQGSNGSRRDLTNSFTYERLDQLPVRLTRIRELIRAFTDTTFPESKKSGCVFPF